MVCRNICNRIKVLSNGRSSEYAEGKKFCGRCNCYFITPKIFCECCGVQLRTKTHDTRLKRRHLLRHRQRINTHNYYERNKELVKAKRRMRYQKQKQLKEQLANSPQLIEVSPNT